MVSFAFARHQGPVNGTSNEAGRMSARVRRRCSHSATSGSRAACLAGIIILFLSGGSSMAGPKDDAGATQAITGANASPTASIRERLRTGRVKLDADTPITHLHANAIGATGSVANVGVPAAIYRSTYCGFIHWFAGVPSWLDQMILFNDGGGGAPLRTLSTRACFDACSLQNLCVGQGGSESCDCLAPEDIPFDVTLQMYDGDPCGDGLPIAGASATFTMDESLIDLDSGLGGSFQCFTFEAAIDPKVVIPHESWIEMILGVDDGWVFSGRPNSIERAGDSPLSGFDDGVDCVTFCDVGSGCTNDPDRCDWMIASADSNAEVVMQVIPTGNDKDGNLDPGVVIDGNTIRMSSGGRYVFLDLRVSDWDPADSGVALSAFAWWLEDTGFTNESGTSVERATVPCASDVECVNLFGTGAQCFTQDALCDAPDFNCCSGAFIDFNHTDFPFSGLPHLCGIDVKTGDSRGSCRLVSNPGVDDPEHFPSGGMYVGTLIVDVPSDARGTFTVHLLVGTGASGLQDQNETLIPFLGLVDATIALPAPCCLPNGTCNDALFEADCESLDGTVVTSCEDTNNNGLGDLCETGGCCVGTSCTASNFTDCLAAGGTLVPDCLLDGDGNGTDDACECAIGSPPTAETYPGQGGVPAPRRKNRFLSIRPGNADRLSAIRVRYDQLPPPLHVWNGMTFFAGQPHQTCENPGQGLATPISQCGVSPGAPQRWFWAAPLVCDENLAAYRDWSDLADYCVRGTNDGLPCASDDDCPGGSCGSDGLVHLYHPGVVPSKLETPQGPVEVTATYEIRMVDLMCDTSVASNYSDPLTMEQAGWSDTANQCTECPCTDPNDQIDLISDCVGVLSKFANGPCALSKTRAEIEPTRIDFQINITDVVECVRAFSDSPYPFTPGNPCE